MRRWAIVLIVLLSLVWAGAGSCAWSRWREADREQECFRWEAWMVNCVVNGDPIPADPDPWGTPYAVFVMKDGRYAPESFSWGGQTVRPDSSPRPYPLPVQVISAGPDRVFGTPDDIHSWDKFPPE